jgi:hypothetical protein
MIGLLLALYPAPWRRRYGEEFRAVLESRPLGPFDVADIFLGALDARLTPFRLPGTASGGRLMLLRIGGLGAILGGIAWFIGIAVSSGLGGEGESGRPWVGLMLVGTVGLLVALVGLSAFQGHRDPALAWVAVLIPGAGALVSAIGISGMLFLPPDGRVLGVWSPWDLWVLGMFANLIGSIFFAIATYQARVLSMRAARALGLSGGAALVIVIGAFGMPAFSNVIFVLEVLSIAAFAGSWVWLGISALRRGPIRAIAPA